MNAVKNLLLPALIVAAGLGVLMFFVKTRPQAEREEREVQALLVETQRVETSTHETSVHAHGQIIAAELVVLSPQVSGRIRWQADALVPGGRFARNERILRVDATDYQLAVEQQVSSVNNAELNLRLERANQRVAEHEWEAFGGATDTSDEEGATLALRQPQVEAAEVALRSAESAVRRARVDLSRTTLRAPFNAMVMSENADQGQLVTPSSQLATLVGTDHFWVQVAVPVEALAAIRIPDRDGEGSRATVRQSVGERTIERNGRVLRLLPDVDPVGAMARVLVEIDDPLGLSEEHAGSLPMLIGSYVDVEVDAQVLQNVVEVPRSALREGSLLYVATPEDTLDIREVEIAWRRDESVLVSGGLRGGEAIIISRVPTPVQGLAIRTQAAAPTRAPTAEGEQ